MLNYCWNCYIVKGAKFIKIKWFHHPFWFILFCWLMWCEGNWRGPTHLHVLASSVRTDYKFYHFFFSFSLLPRIYCTYMLVHYTKYHTVVQLFLQFDCWLFHYMNLPSKFFFLIWSQDMDYTGTYGPPLCPWTGEAFESQPH